MGLTPIISDDPATQKSVINRNFNDIDIFIQTVSKLNLTSTFLSNWTDLTDTGTTTLHKHSHANLDGLTLDDHTQYILASSATSRAVFATNWTDLTDSGGTTLHTHSYLPLDGSVPMTSKLDIGSGLASVNAYMLIHGGTDNGTGSYIGFYRGATPYFYIGNESSITGNNINSPMIYGVAGTSFSVCTNGNTTPAFKIDNTGYLRAGAGGTGAGIGAMYLNGGSGSGGGAFTSYRRNDVDKGFIGNMSAIFGNTDANFGLYGASGIGLRFFVDAESTPALEIDTSDNLIMQAGKKFYWDTGVNSYTTESSDNFIDTYSSGSLVFRISPGYVLATGTDLIIDSTKKLALDGSAASDTYIYESAANTVRLYTGGSLNFLADSTRFEVHATSYFSAECDILTSGAGTYNIGSASAYFGEINYKTLTDRGCLGSFDDGVELQDGTKVSDTAAILAIQKDATKETVYGVPMLDYKTFPKVAYKPADYKIYDSSGYVTGTALFPRDEKDEPYYFEVFDGTSTKQVYTKVEADKYKTSKIKYASDGVEMTSMQSIMLGAIKELTLRVEALEKKVTELESK